MAIKKTAGLVATAALAIVAGTAHANNTIASTVETNGANTDFTFTGAGGGYSLASNGALVVTASGPNGGTDVGTLSFGPITETGAVVNQLGGGQAAMFSGGSFTLGSGLLTGTFASSVLSSPNGSTGAVLNLGLNSVTYTGGTYYNQFLAKYGGTGAVGNLALNLSAINPTLQTDASGYFAPFTAQGSTTTFDAVTVPEPTTMASFGCGLFGLMGLIGRARKIRKAAA